MSMEVTIMECDLRGAYDLADQDCVELSRMVLDVLPENALFPMNCTISWGSEEFEADLNWLQENGVRGYIIVDLEGGEFVRYRLTDERVEKAAGRCYFSGDRELTYGPLMVSDEDLESLQASTLFMTDYDVAFLKENIEELEDAVSGRIMEEHFMDLLREEAENVLASRPEEEEEVSE